MPGAWEEFTADELRWALAEVRSEADAMLDLAYALEVRLPGTRDAFRAGVLRHAKAAIIARATAVLDPGEAREAEEMVLGRAGRLSPGGLRAAIARAVMQVAPEKRASGARTRPATPGWNAGPRTLATPRWSAASSRPTGCWPRTSGLPGGPGS